MILVDKKRIDQNEGNCWVYTPWTVLGRSVCWNIRLNIESTTATNVDVTSYLLGTVHWILTKNQWSVLLLIKLVISDFQNIVTSVSRSDHLKLSNGQVINLSLSSPPLFHSLSFSLRPAILVKCATRKTISNLKHK